MSEIIKEYGSLLVAIMIITMLSWFIFVFPSKIRQYSSYLIYEITGASGDYEENYHMY